MADDAAVGVEATVDLDATAVADVTTAPELDDGAPTNDGDDAGALEEPALLKTRFRLSGFENEKDENLVRLDNLMRFVFPEGLQHPLSTGRLYAFGFYGPLDRNSQLRSGHKGQHVVSRWELDTMCAQFEREDVLQVYILPGRPLAVLSESQQDELIAQADRRIKAQTGKGLMPQVKRSDVAELFDGLKHNEDGRMRFHEMQRRIMDFREDRIKRLKVMYPKVTRKVDKPASSSKGVTSLVASTGPPRARRGKVSPDVAPPEMFQKNKGMNNNAISAHTNRLLSTRAYKICDIESGNCRLLGGGGVTPRGAAVWRATCWARSRRCWAARTARRSSRRAGTSSRRRGPASCPSPAGPGPGPPSRSGSGSS